MKPLVIFGAGAVARLAWACFYYQTPYEIAAFCVDEEYYSEKTFCGLPAFPSNSLLEQFPPGSCDLFVALGYQNLNKTRQKICEKYTSLGYNLISCVSSRAFVLNEGEYGKNCFIMEGAILQPFSKIGDNCVCWSGSVVSHESVIGDNCFLSANCVVGGMSRIGCNTFIGMNATVRDRTVVGESCLIGANSLVLNDLACDSLVAEKATPVAKRAASESLRFIQI